jgi:exopolysaccharide production protein ExoQ
MIAGEKAVQRRRVTTGVPGRNRVSNREFWIWVALLVFQMQPLEMMVSGYDPSFPSSVDSASHLWNHLLEALSLGLIAYLIREFAVSRRFLIIAWPLLAFLAYAILISPFAGDPVVALKYLTGTLVPTLIVPLVMATRMRPIMFVSAWAYALAALCISSVFAAILLPHYGVVGTTELPGIGSPGNWRGVFPTKNVLGHVCGITFAILVIFREQVIPKRAVLYAGIVSSFICLVFSASSTGYIIAAALPAFYYSLLSPRNEALRVFSVLLTMVATTLFIAFHDEIIVAALAAVGKKPNLTGRAEIWQTVGQMVPSAGWIGHGMGYSTTKEFMAVLTAAFGVPYIHNEYLDLVINYGVIGAFLFLGLILVALWQAFQAKVSEQSSIAKRVAVVMLGGWIISGMSETTTGTMNAFYFVPLCALYLLRVPRAVPVLRGPRT